MQPKFQTLIPWIEEIIGTIKKEIKRDYLPDHPKFCRAYFGNLPQSRISFEEICLAFKKELEKGNEELCVFVSDCWVFKHGDIYEHFSQRLFTINPEFDQIKELTLEQSEVVLEGTTELFGARNTYIFSVLNGVVFPPSVFASLEQKANEEAHRVQREAKQASEEKELAKVIEQHQKEIAKQIAKHEQILAGVMRKYGADVAALKKQLLALQQTASHDK